MVRDVVDVVCVLIDASSFSEASTSVTTVQPITHELREAVSRLVQNSVALRSGNQ